MTRIEVAGRSIGDGAPVFVIGEVAQSHDGSIGFAHAFVDAMADAGCDAVKFQTHIADAESTDEEQWRVHFSRQDRTRKDYWRRTSFTEEQWRDLAAHAAARDLVFLSSPFSCEAVDLLEACGVPAWKIASGEIADRPLLERIIDTGLPALVSTGMSPMAEIDATVELLRRGGLDVALFQCTSMYPTPPAAVGLNVLTELRERFDCPVGLSDHSGSPAAALAAVALGASMLEVHATFSARMFGPDVPASLTFEQLTDLTRWVHEVEAIRGTRVDKDEVAGSLAGMRTLFTKSVVAARDLTAGTVLVAADLVAKKPGGGLPAWDYPVLVGRTLKRDVPADGLVGLADVEG